MSTAQSRRATPEEYLAFERNALEKHEYRDGEIVAMAGASFAHGLIASNLNREVGNQLRGGPCVVVNGDLRVRTSWHGLYSYPDLIIVCGEREFADEEVETLLNPTVLVEVLSPSTEAFDRGEKFERYRTIPSLREYVLVAQDRMAVEPFLRRGDDWVIGGTLREPDDTLRLESIDVSVALRDIYAKVTFPKRPNDEGRPTS